MKANAPEKIYCTPTEGGFYLTTIKPEPPFADGVEYIKKDAFIEKAEKYLKEHLIDYWAQRVTDEREFIENFRKYIKGE